MLSIDQLKNIDPELQGLSDNEIIDIRAKLYALADLALECWIADVRSTKQAAPPAENDTESKRHGTLST